MFIVDDEESTREVLRSTFLNLNYQVDVFANPVEAVAALTKGSPRCDLVICDLSMPEMSGLDLLDKVAACEWRPPVILLTGVGSNETAVEGLTKGAFDYISKPVNFTELAVVSDRAIKVHRLQENYRAVKKELARSWVLEDVVGRSQPMQRIFEFIRKVSQSSCNILVTGESGTGKEMVVRAIHSLSPRAAKPFVAINCAAVPEALLESELFGHAKGAFTGATERRRGLIEEAHEGTLFLDEIGDMPLALQAKLLRFLQEKKVKLIGENTYRATDVRVVAATHRNLKTAVREKTFREDLYYRLCVVPVEIPPLRQRPDDILPLAEHFLARFTRQSISEVTGFTKAAQAKLLRMPWAGNVRELENTIERAVVFCEKALIDEQDIQVPDVGEADEGSAGGELFSSLMSLKKLEKEYIRYVLRHTGHKKGRAAEVLGINRKTLYMKQIEYKIPENDAGP